MKQTTKQITGPALPPIRRGRGALLAAGAALLCAALLIPLLAACVEPIPLYGTWADNHGNNLSLFDDESFNAKILDGNGDSQPYSGTYVVMQNILTLNNAGDGRRIMTEWDLRGNVLYLTWPDGNGDIALTLYKISG